MFFLIRKLRFLEIRKPDPEKIIEINWRRLQQRSSIMLCHIVCSEWNDMACRTIVVAISIRSLCIRTHWDRSVLTDCRLVLNHVSLFFLNVAGHCFQLATAFSWLLLWAGDRFERNYSEYCFGRILFTSRQYDLNNMVRSIQSYIDNNKIFCWPKLNFGLNSFIRNNLVRLKQISRIY